jgi:hypothetical protein
MNVINSFLLSLFLKPAGIYKRLGVDTIKLKSLLTCKLIMDDRQPFSFGQSRPQQTGEPVNDSTWLALGIYSLMGLAFIIFFFIGQSSILHFTAFFSVYLVMLTLSLIVDFTRVLIDVRDNFIILPKPVNDRTFLVARILHIAIHISKMAIPLCIPASIVTLIQHGVGGLAAFLLAALLATVFSIFLINATYLAILRFSKPEKFKSIINYLQIGFTVLIYGSYQLLPRLVNESILEKLDLKEIAWMNTVPSYWFASLWQIFTNPVWNLNLAIGSFLAIVMPLAGIYMVVKVFAPAFNQKLTLISGTSEHRPSLLSTGKISPSWGDKISTWITKPGPEQMGFDLSWRMMLRSREFKMQVYPGIGYMLVLFVVFILQGKGFHVSSYDISIPENRFRILVALYSPALLVMSASALLHLSPSWKASWIYQMSPFERPGLIISGSIKAVMAQFMVLPVLLIGFLGILLNGKAIFPSLLMAIAMQTMLQYLVTLINNHYLPFSQPITKRGGDGTSVANGILAIILIGFIVFLHWLIFSYTWLMLTLAAITLLVIYLMHKKMIRKPWKEIRFAKDLA